VENQSGGMPCSGDALARFNHKDSAPWTNDLANSEERGGLVEILDLGSGTFVVTAVTPIRRNSYLSLAH
jgi:hypothetical protein